MEALRSRVKADGLVDGIKMETGEGAGLTDSRKLDLLVGILNV